MDIKLIDCANAHLEMVNVPENNAKLVAEFSELAPHTDKPFEDWTILERLKFCEAVLRKVRADDEHEQQ